MVSLVAPSAFGWRQVATTKEIAPNPEVGPSGVGDQPEKEQPSPPVKPPAEIEGFRQARFWMSEEQVRQAIRRDFPAAAAKLTSTVHPSEKTTVLSLSVADLLPILGTPVFPISWGTARRGSVRSISSGQAMAPLLATRLSSALRTPCGTISVRKTSSPTASSPIIARGEYDPRVSRQ
jgi:hypothetical protein